MRLPCEKVGQCSSRRDKDFNQAKAKYEGKQVIVTGVVEWTKPGFINVRLRGTGKWGVTAQLIGDEHQQAVVGQPLALRGDFSMQLPFAVSNGEVISSHLFETN